MVSQDKLKELLHYAFDTGIWTWKVSPNWSIKVGSVAGCRCKTNGYRTIRINGKNYYSARLAHLYMTGEWPKNQMDHINRIKDDDRWENLRPATNQENSLNRSIFKNNTSGHTGISWHKQHKKWQAHIRVDGERIYLGIFDNIEEASVVRKEAELKYFGEFV